MYTVRAAVADCEKFFMFLGCDDLYRNYEFSGPYGGYILANVKRLDKISDSLYLFRIIDKPCNENVEIEFDFSLKRIYIRIRTVLSHAQ